MTDEKLVVQDDLYRAWNQCSRLPAGYETPGDADRVQRAARRAIAALNRLNIEICIAEARRSAGVNTRNAKRDKERAAALAKLRTQS